MTSSPAPGAGTKRNKGGRPTAEQATELDRRIRESALELFLEHGYEGTSMNGIAAAAGTTKPSLYARFPTKEAVFRAVMGWAVQRTDWPFPELPAPEFDDLEGALIEIATAALRRALDPSMIRLEQVAIAHASSYPEIARRTYGRGAWPRTQLVADLLRHHAASGAIVADDPEMLAELFLGMASSAPARLASFGIVRDTVESDNRIRAAVKLFLRGLRPT
ncbi:TetR/AcrR family transcriptional regulator [Rhodococcus coprophilus]|uniref:TetR family transcriptional regulator n=1 Tax=Rhodococcus coprophilus TaxID=38310 RepID=A0A2X4U717_9NOCA|nr:TetR/AcrR family transcriptional regulator [Rhodococcus coprophilus]MBM7459243.1 AcrR family transcriptional regulator [Rhodococcus coprophilus]SQI35596.1 TetR family transcriptional regulator [Rhodococcus coprophilus]